MMSTLRLLAREIALAFAPLRRAFGSLAEFRPFMLRLGWVVESLPPSYQALSTRIDAMIAAVDTLGEDPDAGEIIDTLQVLRDLLASIRGLSDAPAGVDGSAFLVDVTRALTDLLLIDYLAERVPSLYRLLRITGVIREEEHEAGGGRPTFVRSRLHWDELPRILRDPSLVPERVYGWGTPELDFTAIADDLLELFASLGLAPRIARSARTRRDGYQPDQEDVDRAINLMLVVPLFETVVAGAAVEVGFAIIELPSEGGRPPGIIIEPFVPSEVGASFALGDDLTLAVRAGSEIAATFGLLVRPDGLDVRYPFQPGRPFPSAGFGMTLAYTPAAPTLLLGRPSATRLQARGATSGLAIDSLGGRLEALASLETVGLELVIAGGEPDSFIADVLSGREAVVPIPLGILWSSDSGLGFRGSKTLSVTLASNLSLGPVRVDALTVMVGGEQPEGEAPRAALEIGANISGAFGPVAFTIEAVGLRANVAFEDGNLGLFDVGLDFQPPRGLGLLIDAGPVSGGGYLGHDPALGRYAGALELQVFDIGLKALGLLDTRLPGGVPAYSFVAMIAAELPPLPLGFGFTLNGVGGLLGVHRSADVEQLRRLLREGRLDDLLFAESPVADGPRIAADLAAAFPPAVDRYVFGPMAKIGWGPGSLLEAKVGLVLELPDPVRLILLGTIDAAFPRREAALIDLHLDVLGELDVGRKRLAVDGRLRDSKVASFSIEGEMALRVGWGQEGSFALSIGGFHPDFRPPAGFPKLQRITVPVGLDDNPRVTLQGYLALTSNTFQVGASADVYASAGWFNITGGVDFDALFQFSPFAFVADFSGRVTLRKGSTDLAGVSLHATISGPSPWHASGEACLVLKWLPDPCVGFDATFGNERREDVPRVDPWPILRTAIENRQSWSSARPAGPYGGAILAGDRLDPGAGLTFRQSAVPLNRLLRRFGEAEPLGGPVSFTVDAVAPGGEGRGWTSVTEGFAPAQFEPLSDEEKLSRRSFEPMDAGFTVGQDALTRGAALERTLEYETRTIDSAFPGAPPRPHRPDLLAVEAALLAGATADSPLRSVGPRRYQSPGAPPLVTLDDELFVVSTTVDLSPRTDIAGPGQQGAVLAALAAHLAAHPEDHAVLQVIPVDELAEAP